MLEGPGQERMETVKDRRAAGIEQDSEGVEGQSMYIESGAVRRYTVLYRQLGQREGMSGQNMSG